MKKHLPSFRTFILILFTALFSLPVNAQYNFQYLLAPTGAGVGNSIDKTSDGGYIVAGYNNYSTTSSQDMVMMKTNSNGTLQWSKKYGSPVQGDQCFCVRQTADGGYILCGTGSGVYGSVTKLNSSGALVWSEYQANSNLINKITETRDGGFVFAGEHKATSWANYFFGKMNSAGTMLWSYESASIPSAGNTSSAKVALQAMDKGYFFAGDIYDTTGPANNNWWALFKTDSTGAVQWAKNYSPGKVHDAALTSDSGFVVVGNVGGSIMSAGKFDKLGNSVWRYLYTFGTNADARAVKQTPDGGFILLIYTGTSNNGQLLKLDANGTVQWNKQINAGGIEFTFDAELVLTNDGGYAFAGNKDNAGIYLCKAGSDGTMACNTTTFTATPSTYSLTASIPTYTAVAATFTPVTVTASSETVTSTTYCTNIPLSLVMTYTNPLCYGDNNGTATATPIGGSGPFTYAWSNFGNAPTDYSLAFGTYSITVTDGVGATATGTVTLTQPGNLSPYVTANPTGAICQGKCATLTANASGGTAPYTYNWNPGSSTTRVVCPASTTNYQLDVTDAHNCPASSAFYTETILSLPSGSITPANPNMCYGNGVTLTASGGNSYSWFSPVSSASASVSVNPTSTTTYSCLATNSGGCTKTYTSTVTVLPTPTVSVSASDTLYCVGGSSIITATGANTYAWSSGQTTSSIFVNPSTTTTYTVTGTSGSCSNKKWITITVVPATPPSVGITPSSTSMCEGGSITLTASGASTYVWQPGGQTPAVIVVSPTTSTTYSLTGTVSGGCSGSTSVLLTVNTVPTLSVTASGYSVCAGSNVTMGASGASGYLWYPAGQTTASLVANPTTNTTYTVIGTAGNGCTASSSISITANPLPVISISGNTSICNGSSSTLTASGGSTYSWNTAATTASIAVSPTATSTYTVYGTDLTGCTGQGSITITIANGNNVPICLVTVDSASQNNVIVWEKPAASTIDSFIIYREIATNNYQPIGSVSIDSLSMFVDTVRVKYFPNTGNPNNGTYRYKMATRDTCGNLSQKSLYHNTIYMINNSGTFSWQQLYTIEASANPVNNYLLMRDNFSTGAWDTVASVAGTQQQVNDPAYTTYQNTASWRVITEWSINCSPSIKNPQTEATNLNTSRSNVYRSATPTSLSESETDSFIHIFPNPSGGIFNLKMSRLENVQVRVYTVYGECIYQQVCRAAEQQINLSPVPLGIYFVHLTTEKESFSEKLIINK